MGRYIGPAIKIAKKFNDKIFSRKFDYKKKNTSNKVLKRRTKQTEYGGLLTSKEKILYLYNIRDKQLQNYISEAIRRSENSEEVLVQILETRLDNVVYRLGLGRTRKECRQMVSHKHICVNEKVVNIASALVKVGDVISFKKSTNLSKVDSNITGNVFSWLNWNSEQNRGEITSLPVRKDIPEKINLKDLIEIHAR